MRVISPDDLLSAERDENEVRKDFTPSERVAIGKAIEDRIGERRGRPAAEKGNGDIPANWPEIPSGTETREVAAKAAGFESPQSYRRASSVVAIGTPALVEAMDAGEVSISAASEVAKLPAAGCER